MSNSATTAVEGAMRAGYAARGTVYCIVGGLAAWAAWTGGRAEDTQGALATLKDEPWGQIALWMIAIGLLFYALWRLADAIRDVDAYGTDLKAIAARLGQAGSGLIYGGLGVSVVSLAMSSDGSSGGSGGGSGTQQAATEIMGMPMGQVLMFAAAIIAAAVAVYYIHKGIKEKYKRLMRQTSTTEKIDPVLKAGMVTHGIIIGIIAVFFFLAAINSDSGQAGGLQEAFAAVRSAPFGRILLGLVGLGLVGFGVLNLVMARYRFIPRQNGSEIRNMAGDII